MLPDSRPSSAAWSSRLRGVQALFRWREPTPHAVRCWSAIAASALVVGTIFAAVVVVLTWASYLSADGYVDYVEGLVLFHQSQAAAGENIYDPRFSAEQPYSIPLYGPVWYYLIAPLLGAQPSLLPGRVMALLCMLGLAGTGCYVLRRRFGANWSVVCAASVVWMTTIGTLQFGINNRVDALGCLLGVLAVVVSTARFRGSWPLVVLLLVGAAFTKATAAVAPGLAIVLYLAMERRWREACALSVATAICAAGVLLVGDLVSQGNFSRCVIFSNANPLKLSQGVTLIKNVCKQPILPAGAIAAVFLLADRQARGLAIYAVIAFAFAVFSAAKVGSNTNYFIEPAWATAICLGVGLTRFRGHVRAPLIYGFATFLIIHSTARATSHVRHLNEALASWPMIQHAVASYGASGPLLTMEVGAQVKAGQQPYVADAHIITRLAEAGAFNQQPIIDDIQNRKLAALILGPDVELEHQGHTNWTNEMRQAVARFYRPHENLGRLTVYLPRSVPLTAEALHVGSPGSIGADGILRVSKFHSNGCLAQTCDFRNGKPHGTHSEWDSVGSKWCELQYKSGRLDGVQRYFFEDGQVAQEVTYVDGVRHGVEKLFSANGACCNSVVWVQGVPQPPVDGVYAQEPELLSEGQRATRWH